MTDKKAMIRRLIKRHYGSECNRSIFPKILKYDNNFFTMNLPVYKSLVATIFLRLKCRKCIYSMGQRHECSLGYIIYEVAYKIERVSE